MSSRSQRGLALLELLVGITIGLLVIGAAISSLTVARSGAATVGDMGRLQQQGSFAMRVIGQQLRQAGSLDLETVDTASTDTFQYVEPFAGLDGGSSVVDGDEGAAGKTDTLVIANLPAPLLPNQQRDCLGQTVDLAQRMDATFSVSSGSLRCKSTAHNQNQPLIDGVDGFRVRYRVRSGDMLRVMRATEVDKARLWPAVVGVEVCLDMEGSERTPATGTYVDCEERTVARNDHLHLVMRNVFSLRTQTGS